ncbi:hypothetical protein [uncultured Pontibacter sp.]|uniref:hypothetical protein n=1 Tax=uncultured Pontibacter sp. TaxID=453356 RepID=UPI00261C74AD|nr:hypothetical protein [uncultured Pontibacter sp.]
MLVYEKISKSNRTIIAILMLFVFMALVVADIFISFFGGMVVGVLLFQFFLEARMFLYAKKRRKF